MTQRGTDDIISDRGTDALKETLSHGAYDLMAIQHTLNYAAAKAADDVKLFENSTDKVYRLQGIRMRLAGISGNVAKVEIIVTSRAGLTTSSITDVV
jgi:TRAP-type mannitol/chloroaromatic compound transport system substrate-binding protein